jgi:hypothetical protein
MLRRERQLLFKGDDFSNTDVASALGDGRAPEPSFPVSHDCKNGRTLTVSLSQRVSSLAVEASS